LATKSAEKPKQEEAVLNIANMAMDIGMLNKTPWKFV
jgi:hypothetical protein